jgi:uncharacterized protein (TIGR02231 family)
MRRFLLLTAFFPASAFADQISATSRVTDVTIYAYGAQVTREVLFDAPAGQHDLTIADLPQDTYAQALRIAPGEGAQIASFALQPDFVPPSQPRTSAAYLAAEAEVQRLEAAERAALLALDAVQTQIAAANARAAFLQGVKVEPAVDAAAAANLRDIALMIGDEVLAAGEAARTAKAALLEAEAALADIRGDLAAAQDVRAALVTDQTLYAALDVKVILASGGPQKVTITQFVDSASWQPVYDMRLSRDGADQLTIDRGVLISQSTGEDWQGVNLVLSTANPNAQAAPSPLWPEYRAIQPESQPFGNGVAMTSEQDMALTRAPLAEPVASAAPAGYTGQAMMQGDIVVYTYGAKADIRTGASDLRLALDQVELTPSVTARAIPRHDATAFMMASFINTGDEVLLPGQAYLYRDGTLIGGVSLDAIQPGAKADLAFGAIEGLRLTRDMPLRATGERGLIIASNQQEETVTLQVENLTAEDWDVRLMDLVPFSEQEDLEISYTSDIPVSVENVDGQRGILAWDIPVAAGQKAAVTMTTTIRWPDGMQLQ